MFYCSRCDERFGSRDALGRHKRDLLNHWECHECGKDFPTRWGRIQHYVQSPNHFYCQKCDELFKDEGELENHYRREHHYCALCSKVRLCYIACLFYSDPLS